MWSSASPTLCARLRAASCATDRLCSSCRGRSLEEREVAVSGSYETMRARVDERVLHRVALVGADVHDRCAAVVTRVRLSTATKARDAEVDLVVVVRRGKIVHFRAEARTRAQCRTRSRDLRPGEVRRGIPWAGGGGGRPRARRLGDGMMAGEASVSPWSPGASCARRAGGRRTSHGESAPRSTGCAPGMARADLALFHEFAPPPSGGGHQFLRALVRELECPRPRGRAEPHLGRDPGLPLQLVQLRLPAAAPVRGTGRADGAPRRRADRRLPRLRRRHRRADRGGQRRARGRDDLPVALLAREAPRARLRASRAGRRSRTLSTRRSSIRPRARGRSTDGGSGWSRRAGRTTRGRAATRSPGSTATSTTRATSSRSPGARRRRSSASASSARSTRRRSPASCARRTSYLAPSCDDPCSNALLEALACGLPAAYRDSGGHPELVGEGGLPFRRGRGARRVLARLVGELDERRAAISVAPDRVGRGPLPGGPRAACRHLESRDRGELPAPRSPRTSASASASASTAPPSRARTTCSTCRTPGPTRPGSARRRSRTRSTSGSTRRSWSRRGRSSSSRPARTAAGARSSSPRSATCSGPGEVVSIDIEPVRDDYPPHPRITYLGGRSSTDPDVVAEVRARAEGKRTLVILDSDHSQPHVEDELAEYAPLVPVGGYVIVEDSNIGQIRKDLLPGPLQAIEAFLAGTDEFEIDRAREKFLITHNPSGYLRRVR